MASIDEQGDEGQEPAADDEGDRLARSTPSASTAAVVPPTPSTIAAPTSAPEAPGRERERRRRDAEEPTRGGPGSDRLPRR